MQYNRNRSDCVLRLILLFNFQLFGTSCFKVNILEEMFMGRILRKIKKLSLSKTQKWNFLKNADIDNYYFPFQVLINDLFRLKTLNFSPKFQKENAFVCIIQYFMVFKTIY